MKTFGRLTAVVMGVMLLSGAVVAPAHAAGERITYIYKSDTVARDSFKTLLELNGYAFASVAIGDVATYDFSTSNLVMVADDTATFVWDNATSSGSWDWGTAAAVARVNDSGKPVLGIGEGGSAYFDEVNLAIGIGDAWYDATGSGLKTMDTTAAIWTTPNAIPVTDGVTGALFSLTGERMSVYLPDPVSGVVGIAREETDLNHYPVISQTVGTRVHMLWGYRSSPVTMLGVGTNLFMNVVYDTLGGGAAGAASSPALPVEEALTESSEEPLSEAPSDSGSTAPPAGSSGGSAPAQDPAPSDPAPDGDAAETTEPAPEPTPEETEPAPVAITDQTVVLAGYNDELGVFAGRVLIEDTPTLMAATSQEDSAGGCQADRVIYLKKIVKGSDPILARATTGPLGRWRISGFHNARGIFYAKAPKEVRTTPEGTVTCTPDRSQFIGVR